MRTHVTSIPVALETAPQTPPRTRLSVLRRRRAQPPADLVMVVVVPLAMVRPGPLAVGDQGRSRSVQCPFGPLDPAVGRAPPAGRALRWLCRAATVGERTRAGIGCLCDTSMIARRGEGRYQGHP